MTHAFTSRDSARTNETIARRLEAARRDAKGHPDDLVLVRIEAPSAAPEALLQRFGHHDGVLWCPPEGPHFAGIGAAHVVRGSGPSRFETVRRQGAELWRRLRGWTVSSPLETPRMFGGFAFDEGTARADCWLSFGSARFVLPRVTYARGPSQATLGLAIERHELERGAASEHIQLFQDVYASLLSDPSEIPGVEPRSTGRRELPQSSFEARVEDAVRRIQEGELEKVVAAREVCLSFAAPVDAAATAIALREQAPECLRFVFRAGDAAFIGAPPELLVRKLGRFLQTEAVAGTIDADEESPERRLQASTKDLEEHALVVAAITSALAPVCERTELPDRPRVRRLKHLLHLCTPITARLRGDAHVLDLVERLHPTPAVGGVPTRAALEWIRASEAFDRGWYSGAVGWFDVAGDGEFNVALRSGLLHDSRAYLYAGAGIVRESAAAAEYGETTLKFASMLASLRARR